MQKSTFSFSIVFLHLIAFISLCYGQCEDKPVSPHAILNLDGIFPPFNLGQRLYFRCEYGYGVRLHDAIPVARCTKNGNGIYKWEYYGGICQSQCMDLPIFPHSEIIELGDRTPPFNLDEKVSFRCETGYGASEFKQAICRLENDKAKWILPEIECKLVDCGAPAEVEYTKRIGHTYTYLSNVTYICNVGYEMRGTPMLTCNELGSWEPRYPPYCMIITCPSLPHLENGYVRDYARSYKTVAEYFCESKFHLIGNVDRICQANKTWTGSEPKCVLTVCYDPGPLENGKVYNRKDKYRKGDSIIYSCNDANDKRYSSTCLENGEWSERPPICNGGRHTQVKSTTPLPTILTSSSSSSSTVHQPTNATISGSDFEEDPDSRINNVYTVVIAVTSSLLLMIAIVIIALFCYRKRRITFGKKARTADAVYLGELKKLEKARKY